MPKRGNWIVNTSRRGDYSFILIPTIVLWRDSRSYSLGFGWLFWSIQYEWGHSS